MNNSCVNLINLLEIYRVHKNEDTEENQAEHGFIVGYDNNPCIIAAHYFKP